MSFLREKVKQMVGIETDTDDSRFSDVGTDNTAPADQDAAAAPAPAESTDDGGQKYTATCEYKGLDGTWGTYRYPGDHSRTDAEKVANEWRAKPEEYRNVQVVQA